MAPQLFDWLDVKKLWYHYDMRNVFNSGLDVTQLVEHIPLVKE